MKFRKCKRCLAVILIMCCFINTNSLYASTSSHYEYTFIDEEECWSASPSSATVSEASPSETDATSSDAEGVTPDMVPQYYTKVGEYFLFVGRDNKKHWRTYGSLNGVTGWYEASNKGNIISIDPINIKKEYKTLAPYLYQHESPDQTDIDTLSELLYADKEEINKKDMAVIDPELGRNWDGTAYDVWWISDDLDDWKLEAEYYFFGHRINTDNADNRWFRCNEQGEVLEDLYVNALMKGSSGISYTYSGNSLIISGPWRYEAGTTHDPYLGGNILIGFNGCRFVTQFGTPYSDHNGLDSFNKLYAGTSAAPGVIINPEVTIGKEINGRWEEDFTYVFADKITYWYDEEYSGGKLTYGKVYMKLDNLRNARGAQITSIGAEYGYENHYNEGKSAEMRFVTAEQLQEVEEKSKCTITLNGNGIANPSSMIRYKGEEMGALPTLTRTGYTFNGWFTAASGGSKIIASTIVSENDTYYAHWTPISLNVYFNGNTGTVNESSRTVAYDSQLGALPNANKTGYVLNGWYTTASGGTKISSTTVINTSTTYYAQWKPISYTIIFHANDGSEKILSQDMTYDSSKNLLANTFSRQAYLFEGWTTNANGTGSNYSDKQSVINMTTVNNSRINLYAKWKLNECTITYDANKGSCPIKIKKVICKTNIGEDSLPVADRHGYTFLGWSTQKDRPDLLVTPQTQFETIAMTLYAQWRPNSYFINFNPNGGTLIKTRKEVYYEMPLGELPVPEKLGVSFTGWIADTNSRAVKTPITESTLLTTEGADYIATYSTEAYRISFDANGGNTDAIDRYRAYGQAYGDLPAATRKGFLLKGWFTEREGGIQVQADSTAPAYNQTLHAHWYPITYTLRFDPNGGSGTMLSQEMTYNVSKELRANRFKNQYHQFIGWGLTQNPGNDDKIFQDTEPVVNLSEQEGEEVVLFAQWKRTSALCTFYDWDDSLLGTEIYELGDSVRYPEPKRIGYIFTGWEGLNGASIAYINKPGSYRATYTPKQYTAFFVEGEQRVSTIAKDYNESLGLLPDTHKEGYTFLGWFTKEVGGVQINEHTTMPEGGATYYAHYQANTYTITFYYNGGSEGVNTKECIYGEPFGELPSTSKIGAIFSGWNTNIDGTGEFKTASSLMLMDGNIALYATWNVRKLTCTFMDEEGNVLETLEVAYNGTAVPRTPLKKGYVFLGWDKDLTNIIDNTSFVASFRPAEYRIAFTVNQAMYPGATGELESRDAVYDKILKLPASNYRYEHFKFTGWTKKENGTGTLIRDQAGVINLGSIDKENVVLYAQFERTESPCQYQDWNGIILKEEVILYGQNGRVPEEPLRTGYHFTEWSPEPVNVTVPTTFVAKYNPNHYKVSFSANGGNGTMPDQEFQFDTASFLNENLYHRDYYLFAGWNTEADGGGDAYADGQEVNNLTSMRDGIVTFFAQWSLIFGDGGNHTNTRPGPDKILGTADDEHYWNGTDDIPASKDDVLIHAGPDGIYNTEDDYIVRSSDHGTHTRPGKDLTFGTEADEHFWDGPDDLPGTIDDQKVEISTEGINYLPNLNGTNTRPGLDGRYGTEDDEIWANGADEIPGTSDDQRVEKLGDGFEYIDNNNGTHTRPGRDGKYGTEDDEIWTNGPDSRPGTADDQKVETLGNDFEYVENENGTHTRPGVDGKYGTQDDEIWTNGPDGRPGTMDDQRVETSGKDFEYIENGNGTHTRPGMDGKYGTQDDEIWTSGPDGRPGTADDQRVQTSGKDFEYIENENGTHIRPGADGKFDTDDDEIWTNGPDGRPGTADDVKMPKEQNNSSHENISTGGSGFKRSRLPGGTSAIAGVWNKDIDGYWTFTANGRIYMNEWAYIHNPYAKNSRSGADWFRFDETGHMVTGWFVDTDGNLYYLSPVSDGTLGHMVTGWQWIPGADGLKRAYYFNSESNGTRGALLRNCVTPDGLTVNERGQWTVDGTVQVNTFFLALNHYEAVSKGIPLEKK